MILPAEEFIRRFLLHVLPARFVRIRYYGLWANRRRERNLACCRDLLGATPSVSKECEREPWQVILERVVGQDPTRCPECLQGRLEWVRELLPGAGGAVVGRAPP